VYVIGDFFLTLGEFIGVPLLEFFSEFSLSEFVERANEFRRR
jgi:hypothetical protein